MINIEEFFNTKINNPKYEPRLNELISELTDDWFDGTDFYSSDMATFNIIDKLVNYLNSSKINESKEELLSIHKEASKTLNLSCNKLKSKSQEIINFNFSEEDKVGIVKLTNYIEAFVEAIVKINTDINVGSDKSLGLIYSRVSIDCINKTLEIIGKSVIVVETVGE